MSKYAVISDIHGNYPALRKVMKDIKSLKIDGIVCLGDVIGYNPWPSECAEKILSDDRIVACVKGNHEKLLSWLAEKPLRVADLCNDYAREALIMADEELSATTKKILFSLPQKTLIKDTGLRSSIGLAHGSFSQDGEHCFKYLKKKGEIYKESFDGSANILLVGHTHLPYFFSRNEDSGSVVYKNDPKKEEKYYFSSEDRVVLNPGSVGQPRDRDPRASYGILCLQEPRYFEIRRLVYDVYEVQKGMRKKGLPYFSGKRLTIGV